MSCAKCGLIIDWAVDGEVQPVCYACGPGAGDRRDSWRARAESAEARVRELEQAAREYLMRSVPDPNTGAAAEDVLRAALAGKGGG